MTMHKASSAQSSQHTHQANVEGMVQQGNAGYAPSHEQMSAYVYGLLSTEEMAVLEQRVEECPSFRNALESSQKEKAFFELWAEVPAPTGLAENTLLRIQRTKQEESFSSPSAEISEHSA